MTILARFTNFCDFHYFRKAVATAFLEISKISTINFEIHTFSFYLFKNFCFSAYAHTTRKTTKSEKNAKFTGSEEFIHEEKLDIQIWLDCSCACALQPLPRESFFTGSSSAAFKSRASCNSLFYFLFKGLFICVIRFMNSKCKNFTFSSL